MRPTFNVMWLLCFPYLGPVPASADARFPWHLKPGKVQAFIGGVEALQWHLKLNQAGPGGKWAQGRLDIPDLPLVVRLPEGKTGEGLGFSSSPAEGILSCLVGEPWTGVANVAHHLRVQKPAA